MANSFGTDIIIQAEDPKKAARSSSTTEARIYLLAASCLSRLRSRSSSSLDM
jgi:hypothetical protein